MGQAYLFAAAIAAAYVIGSLLGKRGLLESVPTRDSSVGERLLLWMWP